MSKKVVSEQAIPFEVKLKNNEIAEKIFRLNLCLNQHI